MADEAVPVQVRPGVPLFLFIGAIAQLGERLFCKQEVNGSIPFSSTSIFFYNDNYVGFMAVWLSWLERAVHTR